MAPKKQCSLRWNNFYQHLSVALESLRTNDDFVDVSLCCEGRRLKAHKVVLSSSSNYFRDLFKDNQHPHPMVIFNLVKFDDLKSIVEFMYQGEVVVKQESLQSFLQTAEMLGVQGLVSDGKDKINLTMNTPLEPKNVIKSLPKTITATTAPTRTFESHELNNLDLNESNTDEKFNAWSPTASNHHESEIQLITSDADEMKALLIKETTSSELKPMDSSLDLSSDPLDVLDEDDVSFSASMQKLDKPEVHKRASKMNSAQSNAFKTGMERYTKHVLFQKYFKIVDLGVMSNGWSGIVAQCRSCNKRLRGSSFVTSNFLRHLKINHAEVFEAYISAKLKKKEKSAHTYVAKRIN